jgi:ABC-type uncharacterized transport system ATPase subunit
MNNPGLLIRDEPTKGLDPVNRRLLMYIIEEHKRSGASVITVTHQMEEVERLCDRVILLKDRVSRVYGTVEEVQEELGGTVYRVTHDGSLPASALFAQDRRLPRPEPGRQLRPAVIVGDDTEPRIYRAVRGRSVLVSVPILEEMSLFALGLLGVISIY